jgi:hypothetical protein
MSASVGFALCRRYQGEAHEIPTASLIVIYPHRFEHGSGVRDCGLCQESSCSTRANDRAVRRSQEFQMKAFWRNNGLSLALFAAFALCQIGLTVVGLAQFNDDRLQHHKPAANYVEYIQSSDFIEITMENWESEFLQMFAYIMLTVFLFQKGSSESKDPDSDDPVNADPRLAPHDPDLPSPVKKGGIMLKIYENSLSLAFLFLFLVSFWLHAWAGASAYSDEEVEHGGQIVTTIQYLGTAQFWFESLQNWQSEFFSIGLMVVLSVFLRQRGSPESKPVAAPHHQND